MPSNLDQDSMRLFSECYSRKIEHESSESTLNPDQKYQRAIEYMSQSVDSVTITESGNIICSINLPSGQEINLEFEREEMVNCIVFTELLNLKAFFKIEENTSLDHIEEAALGLQNFSTRLIRLSKITINGLDLTERFAAAGRTFVMFPNFKMLFTLPDYPINNPRDLIQFMSNSAITEDDKLVKGSKKGDIIVLPFQTENNMLIGLHEAGHTIDRREYLNDLNLIAELGSKELAIVRNSVEKDMLEGKTDYTELQMQFVLYVLRGEIEADNNIKRFLIEYKELGEKIFSDSEHLSEFIYGWIDNQLRRYFDFYKPVIDNIKQVNYREVPSI